MQKNIHNLDFNQIIDQLKQYASSSLGREAITEIVFLTDRDEIERLLDETEEALRLLYQIGELPFGGITDIRQYVRRATIGGVLSSHELLDISNFIYGIRQMKNYLQEIESHHITVGYIHTYIDSLLPLSHLKKAIDRCIDESGQVLDGASETLRRIRTQMKTIESRIRDQLQSIIHSKRDVLTDAIVTMRNDRYVVPVRADYKNRFQASYTISPKVETRCISNLKPSSKATTNSVATSMKKSSRLSGFYVSSQMRWRALAMHYTLMSNS